MLRAVYVNQSTTLVQVNTEIQQEYIVMLSSLNTPGSVITIRDIAGNACLRYPIIISTSQDVEFLDGGGVNKNMYRITQPYGFITLTPKTSNVWGVLNTYGFPDASAAANINNVTASSITVNNSYLSRAIISTALISTLSTDYVFVSGNISVGQSTIAHAGFFTCTLRSLENMITSGTLYAGSTISSMFGNITSTLTVPYISTQNIDIYGVIRSASTISTMGPLFVGNAISTTGNLAVGGSTFIHGELSVKNSIKSYLNGTDNVLKTISGEGYDNIVLRSDREMNSREGKTSILFASVDPQGNYARIYAENTTASGQGCGGSLSFQTSRPADSGNFATAMTITNTGNVGIGTMSPVCTLDVSGTITTHRGGLSFIENQLTNLLGAPMDGIGYYNETLFPTTPANYPLKFGGFYGTVFNSGDGGATSYPYTMVLKNGNVGVGVKNPTAKFQVIGNTEQTTVAGLTSPATIVNPGTNYNTIISALDYCTYNTTANVMMEIGSANLGVAGTNNTYKYLMGVSFTAGPIDNVKGGDFIIQAANVGDGYNSHSSNTVLKLNRSQIAIGRDAGATEQTGTAIAIGYNAGQTKQVAGAIAIGSLAGKDEQAGIAIGGGAGMTSQKAAAIAIGANSGNMNQHYGAVAIGELAGSLNQSTNSVAIGCFAGENDQANYAVAIGFKAGKTNQAKNTIAIGALAGVTSQKEKSIIINASGTTLDNTSKSGLFIKPILTSDETTNCLRYDTTTSEITYTSVDLGKIPGINSAGNIGINQGSNTTNTLDVNGTIRASGNITAYSDSRKKENIVTIDSALDKIMKMRGVYYTRKDSPDSIQKQRQVGVIAQEVEEVLPEVVMTDNSEEKIKSVAYGNIVALLIEGVKEQKSTIDYLVNRYNN